MTNMKLYTIPEVSEILKVTRDTIYRWMRAGELKTVKIGSTRRVLASDLEEFVNSHRVDTID